MTLSDDVLSLTDTKEESRCLIHLLSFYGESISEHYSALYTSSLPLFTRTKNAAVVTTVPSLNISAVAIESAACVLRNAITIAARSAITEIIIFLIFLPHFFCSTQLLIGVGKSVSLGPLSSCNLTVTW